MQFNHRVRGILINKSNKIVLMKRIKPAIEPYWVAPGGGMETSDRSLEAALNREIDEELGGKIDIVKMVFFKEYQIEEEVIVKQHFFLCRLLEYDLSHRYGPEFNDPAKGEYIPDAISLRSTTLSRLNIKSEDFKQFLIDNARRLFKLPELRI